MRFVAQPEVEILGEPVGFEETLLEASSTLKNPAFSKLVVSVDAGKHPTEDVILLDDMRVERCLGGEVEDFTPVNQLASPCAHEGGMRRRHLVMRHLQSKAGSNLA